jgi:hypothetical protein
MKEKKVTISVNQKELNDFEDFVTCWNLCNKHKEILDDTDIINAINSVNCPKCVKATLKKQRVAIKIMSKLWKAFEK